MLEVGLIGGLGALSAFLFVRFREERERARSWKASFEFAQQELARWRKEAEEWAVVAGLSNGKLQHTELRLPNIDELFRQPE